MSEDRVIGKPEAPPTLAEAGIDKNLTKRARQAAAVWAFASSHPRHSPKGGESQYSRREYCSSPRKRSQERWRAGGVA